MNWTDRSPGLGAEMADARIASNCYTFVDFLSMFKTSLLLAPGRRPTSRSWRSAG